MPGKSAPLVIFKAVSQLAHNVLSICEHLMHLFGKIEERIFSMCLAKLGNKTAKKFCFNLCRNTPVIHQTNFGRQEINSITFPGHKCKIAEETNLQSRLGWACFVPCASNRDDYFWFVGITFDFCPQTLDVHINQACVCRISIVPNFFK